MIRTKTITRSQITKFNLSPKPFRTFNRSTFVNQQCSYVSDKKQIKEFYFKILQQKFNQYHYGSIEKEKSESSFKKLDELIRDQVQQVVAKSKESEEKVETESETKAEKEKVESNEEKTSEKDENTTKASSTEGAQPVGFLDKLVADLNESIAERPTLTGVSLLLIEIVSIYGCYSILQALGLSISVEFIFSFVLVRFTRRFRYPVDFITAKALSVALPQLKRVNILQVAGKSVRDKIENTKFGRMFAEVAFPFLIASRIDGAIAVTTLYFILKMGVDVQSLVETYLPSFLVSTANVTGPWAAAVVLSSVFYPVSLFLSPYLAKIISKFFRS